MAALAPRGLNSQQWRLRQWILAAADDHDAGAAIIIHCLVFHRAMCMNFD